MNARLDIGNGHLRVNTINVHSDSGWPILVNTAEKRLEKSGRSGFFHDLPSLGGLSPTLWGVVNRLRTVNGSYEG